MLAAEQEVCVAALNEWENFYVILGGSAAALTGLMFVVITLVSGSRVPASNGGVAAFNTPTVVHFTVALLIAAIISAPWTALIQPAVALGITGFGGLIYTGIVLRRLLHMDAYEPVLEDWLAHTISPLLSYTALLVGAFLLSSNTIIALFLVGGVTLLLIITGIHNAWDVVTYLTLEYLSHKDEKDETPA